MANDPVALQAQRARRCPFLSEVTREERECIKAAPSKGICTIQSGGQDWLVCPYRAFDPALLENAARRLFQVESGRPLLVVAAPTLAKEDVRAEVGRLLAAGGAAIAYLQAKLGGEISVSPTARSPELAFDVTLVEIVAPTPGTYTVGRYGILEIQTMDFHGSYKAAVTNLTDGLRLHGDGFAAAVQSAENQWWLSDKIEGPNIANVFKRTFYQMALKFRIGAHPFCVGCILAIQSSVWSSWQRHLGAPELDAETDGETLILRDRREGRAPAWIYVFDTEPNSPQLPNPIIIQKVIGTDAETMTRHALQVVPDAAIAAGGAVEGIFAQIRSRIAEWWPDLGDPEAPRRKRRRPPVS